MISYEHETIINQRQKRGTTTLIRALDSSPLIPGNPLPKKGFHHPAPNRHVGWSWYEKNYPEEFEAFTLIDLVRDPWQLALSWHRYHLKTNWSHLLRTVSTRFEIIDGIWREWFTEQCLHGHLPEATYTDSPERAHILRTEHLETDWKALINTLELPLPTTLPTENAAPKPTVPFHTHYTPESAAAVASHFALDINAHNYRYPWLPGDAIARLTAALKIQRCTPCEQRRKLLNTRYTTFLNKVFTPQAA